jgi:hypothetical protein
VVPDWRDYQEEVARHFRSLGVTAEIDQSMRGVRTTHNVDVVVKGAFLGIELTWIIECKQWNRPVDKSEVIKLHAIVGAVGADRGILLCESGFQSGAVEATNLANVTVTSLAELKATTGTVQRVAKDAALLKADIDLATKTTNGVDLEQGKDLDNLLELIPSATYPTLREFLLSNFVARHRKRIKDFEEASQCLSDAQEYLKAWVKGTSTAGYSIEEACRRLDKASEHLEGLARARALLAAAACVDTQGKDDRVNEFRERAWSGLFTFLVELKLQTLSEHRFYGEAVHAAIAMNGMSPIATGWLKKLDVINEIARFGIAGDPKSDRRWRGMRIMEARRLRDYFIIPRPLEEFDPD